MSLAPKLFLINAKEIKGHRSTPVRIISQILRTDEGLRKENFKARSDFLFKFNV